jgi:hypothetical protein
VASSLRIGSFAILALSSSLALAQNPTADELYQRFRTARLAMADAHPAGALDLYSRKWLEDGISDVFSAAKRPNGEVDHTKDALWIHFTSPGVVNSVISYRLSSAADDSPALELRATTNRCERAGQDSPVLITYSFVKEDGEWRVTHEHISTAKKDLTWYKPDLSPIDRFPYFHFPDRAAVFNDFFEHLGAPTRVTNPCGS